MQLNTDISREEDVFLFLHIKMIQIMQKQLLIKKTIASMIQKKISRKLWKR